MKQPYMILNQKRPNPWLLPLLLCTLLPAQAHISYSGRNLGTFGGGESPAVIANQVVSSPFGWADGTDEDFGDSHRLRAFRFTLTRETTITLSVSASTNDGTALGGLLPAFSIYSGLAHVAPAAADHDGAAISLQYLDTLPGPKKEGNLRSLNDWKIGNDDGTELSEFVYRAHTADGTAVNFGNAPGIIGDGVADGSVTGTFTLPAGSYTVFVGGADYAAQKPEPYDNYGILVTFSAAPLEGQLPMVAVKPAVELSWSAAKGPYILEGSNDMLTWRKLEAAITLTGGVYTACLPARQRMSFYRLSK